MAMITQSHIDQFSSVLREILNNELALGNEITETAQGWPQSESIIIFLAQPFKAEYALENTEYREINDPHYWKAEYEDKLTKHLLACRF